MNVQHFLTVKPCLTFFSREDLHSTDHTFFARTEHNFAENVRYKRYYVFVNQQIYVLFSLIHLDDENINGDHTVPVEFKILNAFYISFIQDSIFKSLFS